MTLRRRWTRVLMIVLLVIMPMASPTQADSISLAPEPGTFAVYSVTTRHERPDGTLTTHSQQIRTKIIEQNNGQLIIEASETMDGITDTVVYQVPVSAVQRSVPGRVDETTRQFSAQQSAILADGSPTRTQVSGLVRDGWIESLESTTLGTDTGKFTLSVRLEEMSRRASPSKRTGVGIWLVPSLIAPTEGIQVLRSSRKPLVPEGPSDVSIQNTYSARYAYSRLTTIDNPVANIIVWTSDFTGIGGATNGVFDNYSSYVDAQARSINWWLLGKSEDGVINSSNVKVWANSNFQGVFPLGCQVNWTGHAYHEHTIRLSNHDTLLQGMIRTADCITSTWTTWKITTFYNSTFPSGSVQQTSWYIVG